MKFVSLFISIIGLFLNERYIKILLLVEFVLILLILEEYALLQKEYDKLKKKNHKNHRGYKNAKKLYKSTIKENENYVEELRGLKQDNIRMQSALMNDALTKTIATMLQKQVEGEKDGKK